MYFTLNEKQKAAVEFCLMEMERKGFDINTPAGICFLLTNRNKLHGISNDRWVAMCKNFWNNEYVGKS